MKTVERHRYRDKEIYQTRRLVFDPFDYKDINMVMEKISYNLTPNMVSKKYRKENESNPMFGHCYHSSQALYYLMDTDVLEQMSAIDYHHEAHWWLRDKNTKKIFYHFLVMEKLKSTMSLKILIILYHEKTMK